MGIFSICLDDFSEFSSVAKYGKPGLSDMLNWIVAEVSTIFSKFVIYCKLWILYKVYIKLCNTKQITLGDSCSQVCITQ